MAEWDVREAGRVPPPLIAADIAAVRRTHHKAFLAQERQSGDAVSGATPVEGLPALQVGTPAPQHAFRIALPHTKLTRPCLLLLSLACPFAPGDLICVRVPNASTHVRAGGRTQRRWCDQHSRDAGGHRQACNALRRRTRRHHQRGLRYTLCDSPPWGGFSRARTPCPQHKQSPPVAPSLAAILAPWWCRSHLRRRSPPEGSPISTHLWCQAVSYRRGLLMNTLARS